MTIASEKPMTNRKWLKKSNGKISAVAFLEAHREFLLTGALAPLTKPLLSKLEKKEILPTPCLEEIQNIVLANMIATEAVKAEQSMKKEIASKAYLATVYDSKGNVCARINDKGEEVDLIASFDKLADADRWADRKLFDSASDTFAVVNHLKLIDKNTGEPMATVVMRNDAISRILRGKIGAVMHRNKVSSSLSWGVHAKNDTCHFSHG
jgi:hypothetical protein